MLLDAFSVVLLWKELFKQLLSLALFKSNSDAKVGHGKAGEAESPA